MICMVRGFRERMVEFYSDIIFHSSACSSDGGDTLDDAKTITILVS